MGRRRRKGRAVHGILLLDKPAGMTSNGALQRVKRLYGAARAGHTGSLDPMATGLLPICLGEATKISGFLLNADKRYRFTIRLGERTDSGDADGQLVESRPVEDVDGARIDTVLADLRGQIEQIPPMHSAVKQGGEPLYRRAHRGEVVERAPRTVTIHRLERLGFDGRDLELEAHCSKGTYIRALAEDIGGALDCGAHVVALRRIGAGPYDDGALVSLDELQEISEREGMTGLDALLLPLDTALGDWPALEISRELADFVRQGQAVQVPGAPVEGDVRLYERDGGFIGLGRVLDDGRVGPQRLMNL